MKNWAWVLVLSLWCYFYAGPLRADLVRSIAAVKPSVVLVGVYRSTHSPRFELRGTGFVVGNGNWVVTNAHVLGQALKVDADDNAVLMVQVKGAQEWQTRVATVLDVDWSHDLALLSIDGSAVAALNLRDSSSVQEGQSVAFMGFPIGGALGFSPVTHRAVVSSIAAVALPQATARQLSGSAVRSLRDGGSFDIFQLDGTAYPGNSGGPLFDPQTAEVLGVVNMVLLKGIRESALSHPSGISYAIPSAFVLEMMQRSASVR